MIFDRAIKGVKAEATEAPAYLSLTDPSEWRTPSAFVGTSTSAAMKVATVSACVEIRSDSMGKLPMFVMQSTTKNRKDRHYLNYLLSVRPNPRMTPFVFKKLLEVHRLMNGNAYVYIARNKKNGVPKELIPLEPNMVEPVISKNGELWYLYTDPQKGIRVKLHTEEILHLKGFSEDGIKGQSVLGRAAEVVNVGRQQQMYEGSFYSKRAQPAGILRVAGEVGKDAKDKIREEWEKIYGGADNAFRVAVLDNGFEYKQVGMSQRDAQFVESKDITVADISRFFLVPLYKLQAGKQSYSSNEQNSIEYVTTALHPSVTQWEEELSYKLLFDSELRAGIEIRINMNAELRGDTASRVAWYKGMRDVGAYSPNEIRSYEDLPDVAGGDLRIAPLNSIPLEQMDIYFDHLMENGKVANQGGEPQ